MPIDAQSSAKFPEIPSPEKSKFRSPDATSVAQISAASRMHTQTLRARAPPRSGTIGQASNVTHTVSTRRTIRHVCNNPKNPPCAHCGTTIIPSPAASLPLADSPSISIGNWTITSRKKPILNAQELEIWESELEGLTLPEMIFGNNYVRIENGDDIKWSIEFNAFDALSMVNTRVDESSSVKVAYSDKWIRSKQNSKSSDIHEESLQVSQHYDWTYTTKYKGTIKQLGSGPMQQKVDDSIKLPLDKLAKMDKILFYDDMILYEDELADNGISMLNVKIRVMDERLLLLSRFFLRVDEVLLRVYDTRVHVEFDTNEIIREFKCHEGLHEEIMSKQRSLKQHQDPKAALRDANWVVQNLPLISRTVEMFTFK